MTANCEGNTAWFQERNFCSTVCVCSRVYGPSEKRMKSGFAISSARRSTSSSRNGRRMRRGVSSIILVGAIDLNRRRAVRANRPYFIAAAVSSHYNIQFKCEFRFIIGMPTDDKEYARPAQPPDTSSLNEVCDAARECTACHLYKRATKTVFGEGPKSAPIMLVGEQPGDYEDVAGKPFVGPAGKSMDQALEEAGIDRKAVYVTNAGKHFKWEPRGKRRMHKKPNSREIAGLSRRDSRPSDLRSLIPRYARARQSVVVQVCAACPCHGSPILSASA